MTVLQTAVNVGDIGLDFTKGDTFRAGKVFLNPFIQEDGDGNSNEKDNQEDIGKKAFFVFHTNRFFRETAPLRFYLLLEHIFKRENNLA